jgi:dTDP-4-amino-4,6-dideoxygalactose transaminase/acetyltransferase-like isoleucine patch superfamily enzyme
MNQDFKRIASDVKLGADVKLASFINLYGCRIGDESKIGAFVEIQKNASVGCRCKISSHTFICEGVTIEDNVFIGHGVVFINDIYPRATTATGELQTEKDWSVEPTVVKRGASIGSGATILANVTVGENAIVGAGSMVTKDVAANTIVAGNPARVLRTLPEPEPRSSQSLAAPGSSSIPFLDLKTPHQELEEELVAVLRQALREAAFIGGSEVDSFEREFAEFCETRYCVGVSNGTDALRLILIAAGIGPGDTVVTVPNTFIATAEAISQAGAELAFVDIDELTYNMDPVCLEQYLRTECLPDEDGLLRHRVTGKRIRAIVPVHLYGQMADMDAIGDIAERYGLMVIEDACQAHGAQYFSARQGRWRRAGTVGRAAAFSFYPGKNLGACGEAGAVTTNDEELASRIRMLRDHGQAKKYFHDIEGYNARLDAIQAGFLRVKLKHLADWNEQRRARAARYQSLFNEDQAMILPHEPAWSKAVYHVYVIRTEFREALMAHLKSAGIGTAIHYPIPLHLQKAYAHLPYREGDFPVTERVAVQILSLPMYPQITSEQQARIVDAISEFVHTSSVSQPALK